VKKNSIRSNNFVGSDWTGTRWAGLWWAVVCVDAVVSGIVLLGAGIIVWWGEYRRELTVGIGVGIGVAGLVALIDVGTDTGFNGPGWQDSSLRSVSRITCLHLPTVKSKTPVNGPVTGRKSVLTIQE